MAMLGRIFTSENLAKISKRETNFSQAKTKLYSHSLSWSRPVLPTCISSAAINTSHRSCRAPTTCPKVAFLLTWRLIYWQKWLRWGTGGGEMASLYSGTNSMWRVAEMMTTKLWDNVNDSTWKRKYGRNYPTSKSVREMCQSSASRVGMWWLLAAPMKTISSQKAKGFLG